MLTPTEGPGLPFENGTTWSCLICRSGDGFVVADPWVWAPKEYAFTNRWDVAARVFRTVYVGDSRMACLIEILAYARPDRDEFPVPAAGVIPADRFGKKPIGGAAHGRMYAEVRSAPAIAARRLLLLNLAHQLGYPDFDAAAMKSPEPRGLIKRVATYLYGLADHHSQLLMGCVSAPVMGTS